MSSVPLIGLRNLARSPGRSGLSLLAITFGVASLIIAGGFIEWAYWAMRESAIQTGLGHVQISRTGYRQEGAADSSRFLLPPEGGPMAAIAAVEGVKEVAPRLLFSGLISRGDTTVSFIAEGVDPDAERELGKQLAVVDGRQLSADVPDELVLGKGLAAALGARIGDKVVLLVKTPGGGINAKEFRVRGTITREIRAYDDTVVRLPLAAARDLNRIAGSHVWVLRLARTELSEQVAEQIRQLPGSAGLEVHSWRDLSEYYRSAEALFTRQMLMVKAIIASIITLTMSNALIMCVLERTGEVGTMMAIGVRRQGVLRLFITEGLLLGLAGGVLGAVAGVALAAVISAVGIPMPPPPGQTEGYRAKILVTPGLLAGSMLLAAGSAALASAYPSWKASRLKIVDALRRNR